MIVTGLSAALVEPPRPGTDDSAFVHDARERAALSRFCLELVEAASGRAAARA